MCVGKDLLSHLPILKCFSLLGMSNQDSKRINQGGSNARESLHDNLPLWKTLKSGACLTLANEHADFGVQQAFRSAAVARHQLEDRKERANVAQPASFVLQFFVHGCLVDTLEHVALHVAQGGKQWERLSLLP